MIKSERTKEKFTAIYIESWMSGSHWQSLTKFARIEQEPDETILAMLKREGIEDLTVYLFCGWPKLEGEGND